MKDGLPYVNLHPYTDDEWDSLPHVILTRDMDWDPSILDCDYEDSDTWHNALSDPLPALSDSCFGEFGDYCKPILVQEHFHDAKDWTCASTIANECARFHTCLTRTYDVSLADTVVASHDSTHGEIMAHAHQVTKRQPDYVALHPMFGWLPEDIIKSTFEVTTQYARLPMSMLLKKHYKSPFPVLNVHQRDEPIATDTIYSDTPAIDSGGTIAQVFVGTESLVMDVYSMKTDRQFVNTLEDQIRERGAPAKLISDRAQVEISNQVKEILRAYCIADWQSEPHHQHKNYAEQ